MPKKAKTLFCQLTYTRRDNTGITRTIHFRIHDVTNSGILSWRMPGENNPCVFGRSYKGITDQLSEFKLLFLEQPKIGCDAVERVVYTRELRISEGHFLNLNKEKEKHILTQEGPCAMYSQSTGQWARDIFGFLRIEE